ncbi:restriction endonuclease S subunit [Clostridium sartagoforme AAU1]|uniref:Restriction endonuclease S subunit n=1 Tax=Clostridium sartagoforme AAU1 TaxID=1202534 RepID=R9CGC2_9CLOT|nr:restriction endonuclease subunit S [Clostridium sartagoforme]EOR28090.1 restriction endonuclease S subunit [Clostridium sartagoforme AAU1]
MKEGYKKTELGLVPNEWNLLRINEITKEHKQGYYAQNKYEEKGTYLVRITDLNNPQIKYTQMPKLDVDNEIIEQYKLKDGDFLFARSGAIGRYGIYKKEYPKTIFASYLIRFRFNTSKVINEYVGYFYESDYSQKQLKAITQGSSNININANNIKSLLMCVPPLKEQEKIADILSTIAYQIEDTDRLIEKTKELKKGLMQRLLTKGIGHKEFKKTEVGEIPVEWEVKLLEEVSRITRLAGAEYSDLWEIQSNGKIIALKGFNIGENKLILNDIERISEELSNRLIRSKLFKGDIVFPCVGTIGKATVIDRDNAYHINQNIAKITPVKQMHSLYLSYFLISDFVKKQILKYNTSSSQPNVLVGNLRRFNIIVPTIEEQEKIADVLSSIDAQIEEYENKNIKLKELKKGLMQQLLTGKIRVI